MLNRHQIHCDA